MPTAETVVNTAAEAAEGVIFSRYRQSTVRDIDITVTFENQILDVDIYLNVPEEASPEADAVIEDAITAAESAVDDLHAHSE
ncbi:MAG: protein of unknown function (DUF3194) [Haloquadratum sp. J07HQX50]|jgi:Protein of unknown function (DUF3194).|nr:MAG: protein of unknown function (DUF3194) [Haloquadratum sp. J07HQX50]